MPEEITLTLPISLLEELRCFLCKGYLSCGPIRCLNNYICGNCTPSNTNVSIHRNNPLEAILSKISFPCIFKEYGCQELLLFGKVKEHESECTHRPVVCPTNTSATCSWKGSASQLLQHFKDNHPDFLKDQAEFQLELNKDEQGLLITVENSYVLIVKYIYKANEKSLHCAVRCCCTKKNGDELFWNVQLINSTVPDSKIIMKMKECLPYDESFYGMRNVKSIDFNKYLGELNDPDCIRVVLNLKVIKSNWDDILTTDDDLEAIKNLKCSKCYHNLLPPLFIDLDGTTICNKCSKNNSNCKPCDDAELLKLVKETKFPCHWRECNFVGKSNIIERHELSCQFRLCRCIDDDCDMTFKSYKAVDHLQTHLNEFAVYKPADEITYKISLTQSDPCVDIFTVKNNKMVLITCDMNFNDSKHCVAIYQAPDDPTNMIGVLVFEHEHYKCKSKEFTIESGNKLEIGITELPSCFYETDLLTVTVKLLDS